MVIELTGLNDIIPDIYSDFRPIVSDGILFLLSRISPERFYSLFHALSEEDTPADRLVRLAQEIPTLHKLGQIIARNQNIDKELRKSLVNLENSIMKIEVAIIGGIIEDALGSWMNEYGVQFNYNVCYEASVAAVLGFTCNRPQGLNITDGVFKVIKPDVPQRLYEELEILDDLANFYDSNRHKYSLHNFRFIETFSDIKLALLKEIDLSNEQRNLQRARSFYNDVKTVKVPRFVLSSTKGITIMEFMKGEKITDADLTLLERRRCAKTLFSSLICYPLFSDQLQSIFHADPHAGNIYYSRQTEQVAFLDWSLAGELHKRERAAILKLSTDIFTKNSARIYESIKALSDDDIRDERVIREEISRFLTAPSGGFIEQPLTLLDSLAFKGVKFPSDLLLFRKAIFTLNGVLQELDPDFNMDRQLIEFTAPLLLDELPLRWFYLFFPLVENTYRYRSLISNLDLIKIAQGWLR
ncbi:MAG: AarF/ABC1/UbiB kinase family protein [Nitrospirae bacterium]|nr:AarF/ABC1/UbiB kinase family protein [Nitrospirota bacterium]